uniref:Uncharacterized protein n=1 Tax=Chromera velia CCMP2878 TaxID=1169474 RepID=A0A0G4GBR7_9ALVE|eukprot:Cvel_21170.t1-p1 / transcript=Cvel_21170.t1 / gene=Cvel_21170 / organism=Chromera_velia_CCMP2878 / gene_product=hypothetical protein / transcript_product=hypothetical protein / location=Cvel_scaffold1965:63-710(+) / protein_length=216 / sequence_SO=supercontig / SO=protein_coding / is_pseudo=false
MLAGQRNLVHSPFLKTRSPGRRSWQYKGLRSGVRYPLLERIEEEGEGGTEQVVEALEGGPARRSREKTVQFMNGWRRLGSQRREKPEENLFARRGTYTGAGLARVLHRATIRMWNCMLGTSNMEPEERANALTAAATSLVTSCSAIKPDVVTKAVYAAGTRAVQVQVTDCERTSRKNLTSYERYKAGKERKINRLGSKRLWGRFFECKAQAKTRDE